MCGNKVEPIGKPSDLCLHAFEKHYILVALRAFLKDIEGTKRKIEEGKFPLPMPGGIDKIMGDVRIVIERVENTPVCD